MAFRKRLPILDDSGGGSDAHTQVKLPRKRFRRIILDEDDENGTTSSTMGGNQEIYHEDYEVLLNSLNASQVTSNGNLPHLPAETLINILEYVSPADILDYRLVCKSFRDAIDTHVMYYHIQNAELIGFLGTEKHPLLKSLSAKDYWHFAFARAKFGDLDKPKNGEAKWNPKGASFHIEAEWYQAFRRNGGKLSYNNLWWYSTMKCLDLSESSLAYGQLRWCVKIGDAVLDFGIHDPEEVNIEAIIDVNDDDDDVGTDVPPVWISLRVTDWKIMLKNFFREERALKLNMEASIDDEYTYSHQEDCLRYMRRKHLRSRLDPEDQGDSRLIWTMDNMMPLWGKHTYVCLNVEYDEVEREERIAVQTLMLLRKEAAMPRSERVAIEQIIAERTSMRKEIEELDGMFKMWQENLLSLPFMSLQRIPLVEDLDPNPVTWTADIINRERRNLVRWREQRDAIKHLTAFMETITPVTQSIDEGFTSEDDSEI